MTPKHLAFAVLFFVFFACSGDGEESGSYDWVYDGEIVEIGTQPAGLGNSDGSFSAVGYYGIWWSASEFNRGNAYWGNGDKPSYLFSVRCVKD